MKKMFELSHYIVYMVMIGCASTQSTSTTSSTKYSEDLAQLRPSFEEGASTTDKPITETPAKKEYVEPRYAINKQLHSVLDSIDRINLSRKLIDGFTIQIYSGQKKEDALSTKRTIDQAMPELNAEMTYVQPTFRIKAGRYYTQLDAQKDYVAIKRYFPSAILVPDKIAVQ